MGKYIDLVLCEHYPNANTYLFYAPKCSMLKKGDLVQVETKRGKERASVVDVLPYVEYDGESFCFIVRACGAKMPLKKVIGKYIYNEFYYSEVENELD